MVNLDYLYDSFPDTRLACELLDEFRYKALSARFDPKICDDNHTLVKSKMFNDEFWDKYGLNGCIYFIEVSGTVMAQFFTLKEAVEFYNGVK